MSAISTEALPVAAGLGAFGASYSRSPCRVSSRGFLFVFVPITGDYLAANLMGGPSGVTVTNVIVEQFGQADNRTLGAVLAVMVLLASMIVLVVFGALLARLRSIRMYFGRG